MTNRTNIYNTYSTTEFNRKITEGIRRAPYERAKAIREFWALITRR